MITLHFSCYWLLLPLAVVLGFWVCRVADRDTGGYGAGLATLVTLGAAIIIFVVVLAVMLGISLWLS